MRNLKKNYMRVLAFASMLVLSLTILTTVFATDITNYTNNTTITLDGKPITADTKVGRGQAMEATNSIVFPDSQAINAGDTLVLDLPKELSWPVKSEFPIKNGSDIVGNAVADPATGKTTVTFTDYFSKNPQNKRMSLKYDIVVNAGNVTEPGKKTFKYGQETYNLTYEPDSTAIGQYEYKYGYQDPQNPKRIKWKVILNATQDKLNKMVITDELADGQVLVEGSLRAVRYATQPKAIESEEQLTKLDPIDNFTKKAEYTTNAAGQITGFTINFGDNWNWPMFMEYTTELTETKKKGDVVNNVIKWKAENFPKERFYPAGVKIYTASGEGEGETTTSTTTMTTTTSTTTTTTTSTTATTTTSTTPESTTSTTTTTPESTTTTTTTEEPKKTSTTTTTPESTTTTTTTTEEPKKTSTTTTTEEPKKTSTTTTTEEPKKTSTTTTTEEPKKTSTTTTTEEPKKTSTTTTTEEPKKTSTTTTEESKTTSTTTTTPESTTSTTKKSTHSAGPVTPSVEDPKHGDSTTTTKEPTTTSATTKESGTDTKHPANQDGIQVIPSEGPSTKGTSNSTTENTNQPTTQKGLKNTEKGRKLLPQTGETVGAGLVIAGIVILSGTVVLKRKHSNK